MLNKVENIVAKGEITHHELSHLWPQCFQMPSAANVSECVCKWERVKHNSLFPIITEKIVCESKGCLKAASSIIQAMDTTADPCNDFHQYACGGWLKETPIPPGYPVWDRFQELSHKNLYMLQSFIGKTK